MSIRSASLGLLFSVVSLLACQSAPAHGEQSPPTAATEPATAEVSPPADETSAPAQGIVTSPQAEEWLDRIAKRHRSLKTLKATLVYDRLQGILGDKQRRFGTLFYTAGPPGKFALHFDRLLVDERLEKQDRWYIFDGHWLIERLDERHQFLAHEIVPPRSTPGSTPGSAPGSDGVNEPRTSVSGDSPPANSDATKSPDPLALGQGPFAVPISPDKDRLLRRFSAVVIESAEDDPANSVHLRLYPKPGARIDYTQVDSWYDRDSLMPLRVRTIDDSENESLVQLSKVEENPMLDEKLFNTKPPTERGWEVQISPWEK
ncbi:MAG: hypothetical protein IT443_05370 [Phycisphaeraceae bacterium]|nr:hypothetical protein [Phycisphaeraceae bacterium]